MSEVKHGPVANTIERLSAMIADADRASAAIYKDMSRSDEWAALVARRDALLIERAAVMRLANAAPDLLSALEGLVRYAEAVRMTAGMGKSQQARLDAAKAALAKAREAEPTPTTEGRTM